MSQVITLLGTSYETMSIPSNMDLASLVCIHNTAGATVVLTVASVGDSKPTFPGTIRIGPKETFFINKGPTDTISGGTNGHLVATKVMAGG